MPSFPHNSTPIADQDGIVRPTDIIRPAHTSIPLVPVPQRIIPQNEPTKIMLTQLLNRKRCNQRHLFPPFFSRQSKHSHNSDTPYSGTTRERKIRWCVCEHTRDVASDDSSPAAAVAAAGTRCGVVAQGHFVCVAVSARAEVKAAFYGTGRLCARADDQIFKNKVSRACASATRCKIPYDGMTTNRH